MSGTDLPDAVMTMLEQLAPIREGVTGYRAQLEADGFSPTMAEHMAGTLHDALIRKALA